MPLTPESLANSLIHHSCTLEELIEKLSTTAEELADNLYSKPFAQIDQLRINLAITQPRARAANFLPAAIDTLFHLTSCPKPEVARRASMAVAQINGMFQKAPPQPPQQRETNHLPDLSSDEKNLVGELAQYSSWERARLGALVKLPREEQEELHELHTFNQTLKHSKGINLTRLTKFQFKGFVQHIETFFNDLAIRFAGDYQSKVPFENSLSNPKAIERVHKLLAQSTSPTPETASETGPDNISQTPVFPAPNDPFGVPPLGGPG
jgi:hypothetical protein